MNFVHTPYEAGDTIAALATPPGEGGVAIVRISGKKALDVAAKIYSGPLLTYKSHTAHCGKIVDAEGKVVDEVLILPMLEPRSYTGEDTVEIHCHGGSLVSKKVLETAFAAGARPAKPGEFTFKAFMNGKIDLAQAEAVQEMICAKNELALDTAKLQLQGHLSQKIESFQNSLIDVAATLEAWIDFPEEDLDFESVAELNSRLKKTQDEIQKLSDTFDEGRIVRNGISLCLAGLPNAGKSSLMNALLKKDRAIVTDIPGTTRDLIEEELKLGKLHVRLIDTAGIRDTQEVIEKEGIRRSKLAMQEADLILLILDITDKDLAKAEDLLSSLPPEKTILVWNKSDLCDQPLPISQFAHQVTVSAKCGTGLEALRELIDKVLWQKGLPDKNEVLITQERHKIALQEAASSLESLILGLSEKISPEFAASDIRHTLNALGTIIGSDITEEILNTIFSKFCLGK